MVFSKGSSLATILENKLKISPANPLTTGKKVIYLSALLQELTLSSATLKQSLPDFNALVLEVHELLKQLLQLQKSDIDTLLAKRPTAHALIRNFSTLSNNYNALKQMFAASILYARQSSAITLMNFA